MLLWPFGMGAQIPRSPPHLPLAPSYSEPVAEARWWHPLPRVHLEQNESAWGRLWLEVPDTAASDSVVMVTVTAKNGEASTMPPTHAFLRLLVQAPAPQVSAPTFHCRRGRVRGEWCGINLGATTLTVSNSPQDQLPAPAYSTDPVLNTSRPAFHFFTSVTQGGAGSGLVGNPWWTTFGVMLLLLGLGPW